MLGPQTESQAGVGHTRLCLQKESTRRGRGSRGQASALPPSDTLSLERGHRLSTDFHLFSASCSNCLI